MKSPTMYAFTILLITSCSSIRKTGLKMTTPLLYELSQEIYTERDWDILSESIPGLLKLTESLLYTIPDDLNLLASATKTRLAYAYSIHETNYLRDKLSGKINGIHKHRALLSYTKSLEHGLKYLKLKGVNKKELFLSITIENGVKNILNDNLKPNYQEITTTFYTANALASLINLQRDNLKLVTLLPIAKAMIDWACDKKYDIDNGACNIFYASYEVSRPRMLGGNPEKGRKIFEKAIKKYKANSLIRTSFIEYYIIPMENKNLYKKQKKHLLENKKIFNKNNYWKLNGKNKNKNVNIFETIAFKRFNIIKNFEKRIFN